jgi:hypothetical protein
MVTMSYNMNLNKQQVQTILNNAPAGADKKQILDGLIVRGYNLEGVDNEAIRQSLQPKEENTYGQNLAETFTRAGERIKGAVTQAQQDFQAGQEMTDNGIITPAGVAKSAGAVVRGVGRTLGTVAGATFAPVLDIPALKSTIESGIEGALENDTVSTLAGKAAELAQKYPEASKDLEDIVNIATVGIGKVGEKPVQEFATKVGKKALTAPSELTASIKALSKPKFIKTIADTVQDVKPKAADLRDRTLAKALRLAPVEDISVIKQSTGNDIGEFMHRFELVKDTPEETVDALAKFQRQNFDRTRDAIALVDNKFTFQDIPELKDTIDFLKVDLQGRKSPEYQQILTKLNEISAKPEFELLDAQYVKNVFDDVESVYKRTGDVRDAVAAQDKAQTIAPVRRFIEDRVQEVYPEIDIRALNNNVQTSRAIMDAVLKRAPKADTSSFFQLGDLAILGVGNIQTPGLGYGALFAKKVFESAPLQLRFSRALAGKVKPADVIKGLTPDKLKTIDDIITKELKASMLEPEQVSVLKKVQNEIYKVKAKMTTTNKIPKNTSIKNTIQQKKSKINEVINTSKFNPLIEEAKKYKSAEEFVNQGVENIGMSKLFHGGKDEIIKFDTSRFSQNTKKTSTFGEGVYLTPSEDLAKNYTKGNGRVTQVFARFKKPFVIDNEISVDKLKKLAEISEPTPYLTKPTTNTTEATFLVDKNPKAFKKNLIKEGYDGVIVKYPSGKYEVVSYDPDNNLLTKSQLIEIYNQAKSKLKKKN